MPTYSSPKPTLTLTSRFIGQNVGFVGGGGRGGGRWAVCQKPKLILCSLFFTFVATRELIHMSKMSQEKLFLTLQRKRI